MLQYRCRPARVALLLGVSICLISCAPPLPPKPQEFVTDKELLAVSLAREGSYYYRYSRLADAERVLRQSLYLFPDAPNVQINLALTIAGLDQFEEAEAILMPLTRSQPDPQPVWAALGRVGRVTRNYKKARQWYEKALWLAVVADRRVEVAQYLEGLAALSFEQGQEGEAICLAARAIELNETQASLERYLLLLFGSERSSTVKSLLEARIAALGAAPPAQFLYYLAVASIAQNDLPQAQQLVRQALARSPEGQLRADVGLVDAVLKQHLGTGGAVPATESALAREQRNQEQRQALILAASPDDIRWQMYPLRWRRLLKEAQELVKAED